jgi:hypothetical protein
VMGGSVNFLSRVVGGSVNRPYLTCGAFRLG